VVRQGGDFDGTPRFEIVRRLGAGGMGVVYEALDREQGAHVALKTLKTSDARTILRFKQEFRALEGLHHPNLVQLGDLVEDRGRWFFTMELVRGIDFLSYVRPLGYKADDAPTSVAQVHACVAEAMSAGPALDAEEELAPKLDEARLRAALAQLARGLAALHGAEKVHRDIKPSNILITPTGRLVLLDFGLVTSAAPSHLAAEELLLGTVGYMSPEQAGFGRLGPEADWYAVGVLLYFALAGCLPFDGAAADILMRKQRETPPIPRVFEPEAPIDLEALAMDLLARDPARRPDGAEVLRRLAEHDDRARASWPAPSMPRASFVGRREQLAALGVAFDEVRAGATVVVRIGGESGIGKTALMRRFCEASSAEGALVLAGRCTERELVPYKAVDGVVDALSQHLARLPAESAATLLPDSARLLPQIFPVLGRIEALDEAQRSTRGAVDPREARARSFAALRELLANVARMQPLVVAIDDLQWADADSLALLGDVLRGPQAPPMLLVCTERDGAVDPPFVTRRIHLERLAYDEAVELANEQLARSAGPLAKNAHAIAGEAAGHPLFIAELARHVRHEGAVELRLDEAVWARVAELPSPARALVELLAVAGSPVSLAALARALDAGDRGELASHAALLRSESLLQTACGGAPDRVEAYHDRVREAVLTHVDAAARRAWHEKLAHALEACGDADPEALAVHWRGAGMNEKAARWSIAAALDASRSLAFERAAALAKAALDELPAAHPDAQRARLVVADALAHAGRGADAAAHYLGAAEHAAHDDAVELRRRAAEQLLRSGHIDEGLDVMRLVLDALGVGMPRTPERAAASLVWNKARLAVRGHGFVVRAAQDLPSRELRRIDACWSVTLGLSLVDVVRAADFQTRALRLALHAGEPGRLARCFAMASAFAAQEGGRARAGAGPMLREAELLAGVRRDPYAVAWLGLARAMESFAEGRWRASVAQCDEAHARFRGDCTSVAWELATTQAFALYALGFLGELRELGRRVEASRRDAFERGDLYAAMNVLTGSSHYVRLSADDDGASRRESSEALRGWSRRGFHMQHLLDLFAQAETDLYVGDVRGAHGRMQDAWPDLERSRLLFIRTNRVIVHDLFARTEVGAARLSRGARREALLRSAGRRVALLERQGMPWSTAMARLLRAGIAAAAGDPREAAARHATAATAMDAQGMKLHAAAARMRAGELDPRTRQDAAQARARFAGEGVVSPERYASMLAP
jgi:hypothetical protein